MTEIEFIENFLRQNRAYVREKYASKKTLTITSKSEATDLLTEVDLTIQERIVAQIQEFFPGDHVLAEESGLNETPEVVPDRCWVIDPIDGTANFVRALFPIFAISVAFTRAGKAVAAGVLFPESGELLLAERGKGALRNGERLLVSNVSNPAEARLDVDFGILPDRPPSFDRFTNLLCHMGQLRCHGSAVASICQIATGDVDAYVHVTLHPWDFAAAQLIVEEAGGTATRLDGSPLEVFDGRKGVLITNGPLHAPITALLTPPRE